MAEQDRIGRRDRPPGSSRRAVSRSLLALLLFLPAPFVASTPLSAQESAVSLSGEVVSGVDEQPLAHAEIRVLTEDLNALTDREGRFHIPKLSPGPVILVVSYLGTVSEPVHLVLPAGRSHEVRIAMDISLEPITAEIPGGERGKLRGFYSRKDSEQGYFITRTDIEDRGPRRLTDMLRRIPGVSVGRGGIGNVGVSMGRGRACPIEYFLDGTRAPGFEIDNLAPGDVAGIEIYPGVARIPVQFRRQAICGAIVIWTRDPSRR